MGRAAGCSRLRRRGQAPANPLHRCTHGRIGAESPRKPTAVEVALEAAQPRSVLLAHCLDEQGHGLRASRLLVAHQSIEKPQGVGDQYAARRGRRVRDELVPSKRHWHRAPPDHSVLGEIAPGDRPARLSEVADDRQAELAAVKGLGAVLSQLLERVAEIREHDPVARGEPRPVRAVDAVSLLGVTEDQVEDRVQVGLRPRHFEPLVRELDRGLEERPPGKRPVGSVGFREAGDRTRHRAGRRADPEDLR